MPGRRAESLQPPDPAWPTLRPRGARLDHCIPLGLIEDLHYLCHEASEALPTCLPFAALDSDGTHFSHNLKGLRLLPPTTV
jgi:hypothetical protein